MSSLHSGCGFTKSSLGLEQRLWLEQNCATSQVQQKDFFSLEIVFLLKDLLKSSETISLFASYWFPCLPMAIITAEQIIQSK